MCYLRSVSEILRCCKSSSFSTRSSWCSWSVSSLPTDPFLSPCNRPSWLALLPSSPPPPPTSSSSTTSPKCSSPSWDWLLDRNGLRPEIESREQHMQSRKKTKQSMNIVNNERKKDKHRDTLQPRSKADWFNITENKNATRNKNAYSKASCKNEFACLCFDMRQHPKRCNVVYALVCVSRYGQTSPHSLNEQSSIIWFQIFLKESQTWTHHIEKITHSAGRSIFSCLSSTRCKQFQSWKRLDMATYEERRVQSWGGLVHCW